MFRTLRRLALYICLCAAPSALLAEEGELVFVLKGRGNVFWQVINIGVKETAAALKLQTTL